MKRFILFIVMSIYRLWKKFNTFSSDINLDVWKYFHIVFWNINHKSKCFCDISLNIYHTQYIIQNRPYTIHHTKKSYIVYHTKYITHNISYTICHTLHTLQNTPYIVYCIQYAIHSTLHLASMMHGLKSILVIVNILIEKDKLFMQVRWKEGSQTIWDMSNALGLNPTYLDVSIHILVYVTNIYTSQLTSKKQC